MLKSAKDSAMLSDTPDRGQAKPGAGAPSREQLLAAAREVFLSTGYAAASLVAIADQAGCSKEIVQAAFSGKETVFLELLSRRLDQDIADLRKLAAEATTARGFITSVRAHLEANGDLLDFARVAIDFANRQKGDGPLATISADLFRRQRRAYAEVLRSLPHWSRHDPELADEAATGLVGMTLGIAMQRNMDARAITPKHWARAVGSYLAALVEPH
jgi:AcrR family transcriptional regulator